MRPSEIRTALASVISALTPRTQTDVSDKFVLVAAAGTAPEIERGFTLEPSLPPAESLSPGRPLHHARSKVVTLDLRISYRNTEEARNRMLDDCDQIDTAITGLKSSSRPQVILVTNSPAGYDPGGTMIQALYSVAVEYDPRDP